MEGGRLAEGGCSELEETCLAGVQSLGPGTEPRVAQWADALPVLGRWGSGKG